MQYLQVHDFEQFTSHKPEAIVKQFQTSVLKSKYKTLLNAVNSYGLEDTIKYLSDVLDTQIRVAEQYK